MAKKKRKRIASRGSVNSIILKTLTNGDKYGYEIIKEVEEFSLGKVKLKQPSLYSSLTRFEEKGIVTSYWGDSDIGGRRHYYHLTSKGKFYYEKEILKLGDDGDDDIVEIEDELEIKKTNNNENIKISEIDENEIPATFNFEVKKDENNVIADHDFHNVTPIEKEIKQIETNNLTTSSQPLIQTNVQKETQVKDTVEIWRTLSDKVKISNRKCAKSSFKRLHYIKPKKSQKVILDSDGIYKLRDADYVPVKKHSQSHPKIIDNVGKRIANKNYGYAEYTEIKKESSHKMEELSDEERQRRNQIFLEKFHTISQSKMKEVEPKPAPAPEKTPEKEVDYRSKLDLFANNEPENNDIDYVEETESENNLFNYVDEDNDQDEIDKEEDKFINFDSVEFETKNENKNYIEKINNYNSQAEDIKISRYESKPTAILNDKQFVLINKVRCVFGVVLLVLFLLELSISYVIFKNNNLIFSSDKTLFIIAYILSVLITIGLIIPVFINPNKHKLNNFNLKYCMIFGILTFLVSIVLVYCFNSLGGFVLDNFNYFAVKLIVPLILTLNFVITPPIYYAIIKSKRFYD